MSTPMFASIRKYNGAPSLVDEVIKHQDEIKSALKPISGFNTYYLLKTNDGVVSMTVCDDKAGADESSRVEAQWFKEKLPTFATGTPEITTGEVRVHLNRRLATVGA